MRRNFIIRKDKRNRKLFLKFENRRNWYKFYQKSLNYYKPLSYYYTRKLMSLPKNSSISRIKNYCIITGRSRSNYRFFRLTRMQLRKFSGFGDLVGVRQASW